jgi:hypothetical protein
MNPVYETMTKWVSPTPSIFVRVWVDVPSKQLFFGPDTTVLAACERTYKRWADEGRMHSLPRQLVIDLSKVENVVAIEVLDDRGNGGLFYPDWS